MRAVICVDLDNQAHLSQLIETMTKYVTLHSIQLDNLPSNTVTSNVAEIPHIAVRLFGPMTLSLNGHDIALHRPRVAEVLAYLLLHGGSADRDALCDALWPQTAPQRAQACLHSTASCLRKHLGATTLTFHTPRYQVNTQAMAWQTDVEMFFRLSDQGLEADLLQAQQLAIHPLLAGLDAAWVVPFRTRAEQRYAAVLFALADVAGQRYEHQRAKELYLELITRNPLDEVACAGAMRCCIALHQRAEAIGHFRRLQTALDEELGLLVDERSEAYQLYMQLIRGE